MCGYAGNRHGRCSRVCLLVALGWLQIALPAQSISRTVQGTVTDQAGNVLAGAAVQLEDTTTLQVRSYITQKNGTFYFGELIFDVEYRLKAEYHGKSSAEKTLSRFEAQSRAVINLKIPLK